MAWGTVCGLAWSLVSHRVLVWFKRPNHPTGPLCKEVDFKGLHPRLNWRPWTALSAIFINQKLLLDFRSPQWVGAPVNPRASWSVWWSLIWPEEPLNQPKLAWRPTWRSLSPALRVSQAACSVFIDMVSPWVLTFWIICYLSLGKLNYSLLVTLG